MTVEEKKLYHRIDLAVFLFLMAGFVFVSFRFAIQTFNIVLIKDVAAPFITFFSFFVCFVLVLHFRGTFRLPHIGIEIPILCFIVFFIASILISPVQFASVEEVSKMLSYFLLLLVMVYLVRTRSRILGMTAVIAVLGGLSGFYYLCQWNQNDVLAKISMQLYKGGWLDYPFSWGSRAGGIPLVGTQGNKAFYSAAILPLIPVVMGIIFYTKRLWIQLVCMGTWGMMTLSLVPADSRSANNGLMLGTFLYIVVMIVVYRKKFLREKKFLRIYKICAVLLMLGVIYSAMHFRQMKFQTEHLVSRFASVLMLNKAKNVASTNVVRMVMWRGAMRVQQNNPIMGCGIGTFNMIFPTGRPYWYHRYGTSHNTRHAHSEFVEWAMETGILGTSLFFYLIALSLLFILFVGYRMREHPMFPLLLGYACGIPAFLGQNLSDVSLRWTGPAYSSYFVMAGAVSLAYWMMYRPRELAGLEVSEMIPPLFSEENGAEKEEISFAEKDGGFFRFFSWVIVVPVFSLFLLIYFGTSLDHPMKNIFGLREKNPIVSIFAKPLNAYTQFVSDRMHLNLWKSDHDLLQSERIGGNIPRMKVVLEHSLKYLDFNLSSYYKLAYVYLSQGRYDLALSTYKKLQRYAPNYAQIHNNLGIIYQRLRDTYHSLWEFERATIIEGKTHNQLNLARYYINLHRPRHAEFHLREPFGYKRDGAEGQAVTFWFQHSELYLMLAQNVYSPKVLNKKTSFLNALENAVMVNPENIGANFSLASFAVSEKNYPLATECLKRALFLNPYNKEAFQKMVAYFSSRANQKDPTAEKELKQAFHEYYDLLKMRQSKIYYSVPVEFLRLAEVKVARVYLADKNIKKSAEVLDAFANTIQTQRDLQKVDKQVAKEALELFKFLSQRGVKNEKFLRLMVLFQNKLAT